MSTTYIAPAHDFVDDLKRRAFEKRNPQATPKKEAEPMPADISGKLEEMLTILRSVVGKTIDGPVRFEVTEWADNGKVKSFEVHPL